MKNLFEPVTVKEIHSRLNNLTAQNERRWGKMTPAQALAHCCGSMEWVVKDIFPSRMFIGRILGGFIKPKVLGNDAPMRPNSPTDKTIVIDDDRDFATERERLSGLIDRFVANGSAGCTTHPHPFFGRMTPDEWAILTYKHLDHHLRQFSA